MLSSRTLPPLPHRLSQPLPVEGTPGSKRNGRMASNRKTLELSIATVPNIVSQI